MRASKHSWKSATPTSVALDLILTREKMQATTQWRFPDGKMPWASSLKDSRNAIPNLGCETPGTFSLPHASDGRPQSRLRHSAPSLSGASELPWLVDQISKRLRRGHFKVALRMALLRTATGIEFPRAILGALDEAAARCTSRELNLMWSDALAWARFTGAAVPYENEECPLPSRRQGLRLTMNGGDSLAAWPSTRRVRR